MAKTNTVHIGCVLTEEEYQRFKEVAIKNGAYVSEAARWAILAWTEAHKDADGKKENGA